MTHGWEVRKVSKEKALSGIVVADFSRVLAGPLATMNLGDLGADVIKVERPGIGDDTRAWGPPYVEEGSTYYLGLNRNKRSITLDFGDPEDLESAREIAARADVFVENFRPAPAARQPAPFDRALRDLRSRRPAVRRGGNRRPARRHPRWLSGGGQAPPAGRDARRSGTWRERRGRSPSTRIAERCSLGSRRGRYGRSPRYASRWRAWLSARRCPSSARTTSNAPKILHFMDREEDPVCRRGELDRRSHAILFALRPRLGAAVGVLRGRLSPSSRACAGRRKLHNDI